MNPPYRKPKEQGGILMRRINRLFDQMGFQRPLDSDILIAVSGGADSIALAHLLTQYGRRLIGKGQVTFLHVNHHWRAEESNRDEDFVRKFAKQFGIALEVAHGELPQKHGLSLENEARKTRKAFFSKSLKKLGASFVFTAHHADDLFETLVWRIFTGNSQGPQAQKGGILFSTPNHEVRPFLSTSKSEILRYLQEEGLTYRMDSSNQSSRFLRNRIRADLTPVLSHLFPRAIEHLVKDALDFQQKAQTDSRKSRTKTLHQPPLGAVFEAAGLYLRKENWREVAKLQKIDTPKEINLPDGWRLRRIPKNAGDQWILERE